MSTEHVLPAELPFQRTSLFSVGSSVANVNTGVHGGYEYVAFDYDSQSGDTSHSETVVAIRANSPKSGNTNLSHASGLQMERVGEWIFAFEPRHIVCQSGIGKFLDEILNLLDYSKAFPQNL